MDDVTAAKLAPEAERIGYEPGATGDRHAVQDDIGNECIICVARQPADEQNPRID